MSNLKANYLAITLIFSFISSVFGQWSPVDSGTTSNLNGAILLDSGTGFVRGRYGHDSEEHRRRSDLVAAYIGDKHHVARHLFS